MEERKLPKYYNICDLFVMPSSYIKEKFISEGFGIVFLEANACGKQVIGSANAGMTDAIVNNKTGLLLKTDTLTELENAILTILLNPKFAKKLGKNGLNRVQNEFNWSVVSKKFESEINASFD